MRGLFPHMPAGSSRFIFPIQTLSNKSYTQSKLCFSPPSVMVICHERRVRATERQLQSGYSPSAP
uniref:Uncharacterized protein n=1 Tax=Anguilla anguilla TaxID=7936 RepID=A0A0E9SLL9_ANGAN